VHVRRVLGRSLIDPSPRQRTGTFFALSITVFSRKKASLPRIIHCPLLTWLQLTSGCFQNSRVCRKESVSWMLRALNHLWRKILTDIPVQDFKNCFEQWPKQWEYCKGLEGDYFKKF
jgi:hypothetical protein